MTGALAMGDAARVVSAARRWIGTPFVHGACARGMGTDCLGLVRGLWAEMTGGAAHAAPYPREWPATLGPGALDAALRARLAETEPRPGTVALLRVRSGGAGVHCGVLAERAGAATLIHAYDRAGVVESPLGEAWRRMIVAAFVLGGGDD